MTASRFCICHTFILGKESSRELSWNDLQPALADLKSTESALDQHTANQRTVSLAKAIRTRTDSWAGTTKRDTKSAIDESADAPSASFTFLIDHDPNESRLLASYLHQYSVKVLSFQQDSIDARSWPAGDVSPLMTRRWIPSGD